MEGETDVVLNADAELEPEPVATDTESDRDRPTTLQKSDSSNPNPNPTPTPQEEQEEDEQLDRNIKSSLDPENSDNDHDGERDELTNSNHPNSNEEVATSLDICACCTKSLNLKSASDCEDEGDPPIKLEVDFSVELPSDDPDGGDTSIPKPPLPDILATIFEYPYVARRERSVFGNGKDEFDLCPQCDRILNQLYPMYNKFIEILHHEGQIWKTLLKVGNEPILPMLIYDEAQDGWSSKASQKQQRSSYLNSIDDSNFDEDFNPDYHQNEDPDYDYKPKKTRRPRKTNTPKRLPTSSPKRKRKSNNRSSDLTLMTSTDNDIVVEPEIFEVSKSGRPLRKRIRKFSSSEDESLRGKEDTDDEDFILSDHSAGGVEIDVDVSYAKEEAANENKHEIEVAIGAELNSEENLVKVIPKKRRARRGKIDISGKRKKKSSKKLKTSSKPKPKTKTDVKVDDGEEDGDKNTQSKERKKDSRKRIRPNRRKENWLHLAKGDPSRTCPVCGKLFYYPRFMEHHRITVHEGKKPYECKACGKGFTQKFILKKHKCDYSQVTDGDRDFLKLAREEKLRCFLCDICGKKFKERCHLNNHKLNHREDRPFNCEKCSKCFRRRDHLRMHIRVVHNNERKFVCTLCGKTFKIMSNLKAHERRHNFPDEKHLCPICGKSFDTISLVNRHQMTHDEILPFQCNICGKRFKMKDYLGQHLRKGKSCKPGMKPRVKDESGKNNAGPGSSSLGDGDAVESSSMENFPHPASFSIPGVGTLNLLSHQSTSAAPGHSTQVQGHGPFNLPENANNATSHHLPPHPHDFPIPFPYSQLFGNQSLTEL